MRNHKNARVVLLTIVLLIVISTGLGAYIAGMLSGDINLTTVKYLTPVASLVVIGFCVRVLMKWCSY